MGKNIVTQTVRILSNLARRATVITDNNDNNLILLEI